MRIFEKFDSDRYIGIILSSLPYVKIISAELRLILFEGVFLKDLFVLGFHN